MEIPSAFPAPIPNMNADGRRSKVAAKTNAQSQNRAFNVTLKAELSVSERIATYTREAKPQAAKARAAGNEGETTELNDVALVNKIRAEIHEQVQAQTISLVKSLAEQTPELGESLAAYFEENPEAAEQIANGEVPEYFNVENTARRILDVYFNEYNGEDRAEFADRARTIIEQAYGDVEGMVGGDLPSIVQETRAFINQTLDDFAAGEDISDRISADLTQLNEITPEQPGDSEE